MVKPLERFGSLLKMSKTLYNIAKSFMKITFRWDRMGGGNMSTFTMRYDIFLRHTSPVYYIQISHRNPTEL